MKKLIILSLFVLIFLISCSKTEVKQVTEDSKTATEAFLIINNMKDAYVKRDMKDIESCTTRDGYRTILGAIKNFDSVDITFNPAFVEIDGDAVNVNVSWKGTWKKDGKIIDERGIAIFVLKGRPLKVHNILRANPFRYPE